jgi:lactate dehydrogenase-like 2-hydroxyacid dehydrogenase
MTKPSILSFETYDAWDAVPMEELFEVHQFPVSGTTADLSSEVRESIRAFAFKGHSTLGAEIIDAFPNLALIANYGPGYDTIDVAYAASKNIKVSNTPDVLTDDVADLAVGMLIAVSRDICGAERWVSSGDWAKSGAYPLQRTVTGKTVGIVGMGRIGRAVADRLQSFKMDIHYFSRNKKDYADAWAYHDDVEALAKVVDILIVAVSAGPDTADIISKDVIKALGSDGILVNVSRGITVDENALIDALETGELRAAALDVYKNEPNIDARLLSLQNVLLQPHQSSGTIETRKKMGELQRKNLLAFFADEPLLTPI